MGNTVSSPSGQSPIYDRQTFPRSEKRSVVPKAHTLERSDNRNQNNGNQENSRMLFLMYLINRTWNVVVDGKGSKRWVNQRFIAPELHAISLQKTKPKTRKRRNEERCLESDIIFTFISTLTRFVYVLHSYASPSDSDFLLHSFSVNVLAMTKQTKRDS